MSAVIVARGAAPAALELCLRSAIAEPWLDDILVVDQGDDRAISSALRALRADRRDVRIVRADPLLSAAAAANRGAENARGRWLLFLDPNVVLQRGAVSRMAAAAGGSASPWIVGGRLTDLNGRERPSVRAGRLTAWSALAMAVDWPAPKPFRPRRRRDRGAPRDPAKVAAVSSSLMLVPRGDFQALEGFDEKFATHGADLDLCRRAGESGGSVWFQPEASGVQFAAPAAQRRREAQGLARFMSKSAKTPLQRGFALIAGPACAVLVGARILVAGRPPVRR